MLGAFDDGKTLTEVFKDILDGKYHFGLYFTVIMLGSTILMLSSSENYKGAWIYRTLPLDTPIPIFKGAIKSYLLKFIIPIYLFTSIVFVLITGLKIIPDIILIFFNMMIVLMFIFRTTKKELPPHKDSQYTQGGSTVAMILLSFFIAGVLGGIHFLLSTVPFGVTSNIAVSILISVLLWRSSFRITWKGVTF